MIDHNKFQNVIKKAFNRVSTFKNTPWYNETNVKSRKRTEIEDINIQQCPQTPIWNNSSSTFSNINYSNSFPLDISFSSLHTINGNTYIVDGIKSPGIYLDVSSSVALFVRLKLVALNDPDICSNSISYTAYSTDTSDNLLLENAYNFSYNSQLNVASGIEVFKPYNYTLEYYNVSDSSFVTLEHNNGNWIFDNDTGIIVFEENPINANSENIDLDNVDLYFTFVKYIGVQGLENLMYYKNGKIGIGNEDPQSELDISGSVNITGDLDVGVKVSINDDLVFIDNSYVGINTNNPQSELDVSGSVIIYGDLSINCGIGPGFFPIGAIIVWPTNNFPNGYGEWLLCDGNSNLNSDQYQDLSNVLGSVEGKITLPNFQDNYVKMPNSGTTNSFSIAGENVSYFKLEENHVPDHSHTSTHTHNIIDNGHTHQTNAHYHNITDSGHTHQTKDHSHDISDNGHSHTLDAHSHNITDSGHTHNINRHSHDITRGSHQHQITEYNATLSAGNNTSGGGSSGVGYDNVNSSYTEGDEYTNYTTVQYDLNSSSQNSGSSTYDVSLAANNSNSTRNATISFTIGTDVLDSSYTTVANSTISVNDSGETDTTDGSSNLVVGNVSGGTTNISNNISRSDYDNSNLSLDISGLEHTTAFFFIRAK